MSVQAPSAVVMIRPHHFHANTATAGDNAFQTPAGETDGRGAEGIAEAAYREVSQVAETLEDLGVSVLLFEDTGTATPDSVFPNNWFSTHAGGRVAVYPMYVPNRRLERRSDILEALKSQFRVQEIIDYSGLEQDSVFLEGTGAMVLDYAAHVAYVARSNRADPVMLERFCTNFGYEPMVFDARDPQERSIYHTNVMMCIATEFALIGLDAIGDERRRAEVADRLGAGHRPVIPLTFPQIQEFAGNALELDTPAGRVLVISRRGLRSLRDDQLRVIQASCRIVPVDIPTIETAGGSVRCMLAGIHLERRPGI